MRILSRYELPFFFFCSFLQLNAFYFEFMKMVSWCSYCLLSSSSLVKICITFLYTIKIEGSQNIVICNISWWLITTIIYAEFFFFFEDLMDFLPLIFCFPFFRIHNLTMHFPYNFLPTLFGTFSSGFYDF